jgi:hypothetical protein
VIVGEPSVAKDALQVACPLAFSATALHPVSGLPPTENPTVPGVTGLPVAVTVAVNTVDLLGELVNDGLTDENKTVVVLRAVEKAWKFAVTVSAAFTVIEVL